AASPVPSGLIHQSVSAESCWLPLTEAPPPGAHRLNHSAFCAAGPWTIRASLRGMPAMKSWATAGTAMAAMAKAAAASFLNSMVFPPHARKSGHRPCRALRPALSPPQFLTAPRFPLRSFCTRPLSTMLEERATGLSTKRQGHSEFYQDFSDRPPQYHPLLLTR